jgi:hypothetical protein
VVEAGYSANANRWVTQVLSRISSAQLEDVVFELVFPPHDGITSGNVANSLEWHNVDVILQRSTFSSLKNVRFWCNLPLYIPLFMISSPTDRLPLSSAHTRIMEGLSQCHARGIVSVDNRYS